MSVDEIKAKGNGQAPVENLGVERGTFDHLNSRVLTFYHEAKMIRERKMPPPRMAIVYPTYVCNQDCLWCEYDAENTEHNSIMSKENLRQLAEDLHRLQIESVEFCGGGEPTLHPILAEVIRDLKENKGISVGILTNGTKLKGELAEAVVDCCSYVRVGFDGGTIETCNAVKRPKTPEARVESVIEKLRDLMVLRNERKSACRISMKVVVDQNNMHELEECVKLYLEMGLDSVQFKAARLVDSEVSEEEASQINVELERLRAAYPDAIILGGATKVDIATKCWLTPFQVTIDALGEAFLCCYYRHRKEAHSIGNCFESNINDFWYANRHWEAIDGIKACECNNLDCRFVEYNKILDSLMADEHGQFEFI
jgi:MoaA/NifB/PqqE/SkfB family radical SAM enzyme